MFARTSLTIDPAWPWSLPGVGVTGLALLALALGALTVWTYLGVRQATFRRVLAVLLLRLIALAVAVAVVLRPSLAHEDEEGGVRSSKLLILADVSESMSIADEFNNLSRFDNAKRLLTARPVADLLKQLGSERKIEVAYFMGAETLRPLDLQTKPQGKRTDIGLWLHELWQQYGKEPNLRGLVLLSDGADNGTRYATLEEAAKFRGACPIFPFGLGKTDTSAAHKDIAIDKLTVDPEPVLAKNKMTVKAYLSAPGFEDAVVRATLWLEDTSGKMAQAGAQQTIDLRRAADKVITFITDAPDRDGEMKVSVRIEPFPGEVNVANNEASTFVNVSKDGVSILWIEGKLRYESRFAMEALSKDRRFNVFRALKTQGLKPRGEQEDFLNFDKRHYDVIVIGDIAASRLAEGQPDIFDRIRDLVVQKGSGLVMLAGYDTFGYGDWQRSKLASLLPARFDQPGQIETKVKVRPMPAGDQYLLKLALDPKKQEELWSDKLEALEGMTPMGTLDPTATVYAYGETATAKLPILASVDKGKGRVLVFGGDTTYQAWRRSPEAIGAYERFWTQMMLWLARQEHSKGSLWVRPDTRRFDLGQADRLGFTVQFTKGAGNVLNPKFTAKVVGPNQSETAVNVAEENQEQRGYFASPLAPGEYRIVVEGSGIDDQKQPIQGKDSARFMVYDEDRENLRPAADHDLLKKIAQASGGEFALAEERKLVQFLSDLAPLQDVERVASSRWPDWRRNPASTSVGDQAAALWQSSALLCFLVFAGVVCTEWFLRRRWGLV